MAKAGVIGGAIGRGFVAREEVPFVALVPLVAVGSIVDIGVFVAALAVWLEIVEDEKVVGIAVPPDEV
jgi:hypothetical protein